MSPKIRPIIIGILAVCIISIILYIDFSTERIHYGDYADGEYPCVTISPGETHLAGQTSDSTRNCHWNIDHPNAIPENFFKDRKHPPAEKLSMTRIVDVEREKLFKIMADVKNYPEILPKNIISVKIIEETDSSIIAEETIIEQGIRVTLLVKHTFVPYEKHTIEILDGDAKASEIIANFTESDDNKTEIQVETNLKLDGILAPFGFLALGNINSAMDTIISTFADRAIADETESERIVNQIYTEILNRPADETALFHYSPRIQSGEMTLDDLRQLLLDSNEFRFNLLPSEIKLSHELSDETKRIVNNLYTELLGRHADVDGIIHWGSMIEANKMTHDDLRHVIMTSTEYVYTSDLLIVDDVSIQDGIPIVLNWSVYKLDSSPFLPDQGDLVIGYHIYRDHKSLVEIKNLDQICSEGGCTYEDHGIVEGNSYLYQIAPITFFRGHQAVVGEGCLDMDAVCFGLFTGTKHYPSFTGYAKTQP